MRKLLDFATNEEGATAVEYGIIALAIAIVIVVAVNQVGTNLNDGVYTDMGTLF